MRRVGLVLVLVLLWSVSAAAEDEPAPASKPPTPEQAAVEVLAVVLTPTAQRILDLGAAAAVQDACAGASPLLEWPGHRGRLAASDETAPGDVDPVLARLRALLVEPLGLDEDVTTVIVSPEGPLCYVPFGALFGERSVAFTPSGTTHVLLREEEHVPGHRVLALGDPDYGHDPDRGATQVYRRGGSALVRLPATADEARAVGDVVLTGQDANEVCLRQELPKESHWRAVHLACHGLVDAERPTLSSLALTRAGQEDGFLTALEVLQMDIPADLVVLSACETAKGKVVAGEGIVGLTRAFMYAGAPRVLCSLWKVDDEATQALMVKFYELWNPRREPSESKDEGREPLGAATALRKAQEYVRGHEKWKHPYYWAAWVLWGLPE